MNPCTRLNGLVAATHTPFDASGALNLQRVEQQATHLLNQGVHHVFIGGTTGECTSLTQDERRRLTKRWMEVARDTPIQVLVHVGSNCLDDARELATQAAHLGAAGISAFAPSYFKPGTLADLVDWCEQLAAAAPATPFHYYHIPPLTGVNFPMSAFLIQAADRISNLRGIKFSHSDLTDFQRCVDFANGAYDLSWGIDESLAGAIAMGARSAVGSSYNFAAPISLRLMQAFAAGDLLTVRREQARSAQVIAALASHGYLAASKLVMAWQGVDVGKMRPPHRNLTPTQESALRQELERLEFLKR